MAASAIFVNGLPGSGKTYSVVGMVQDTPWAGWACVSVGPPGSNSTFETEDWPRVTVGKKKGEFKHAVKRAATLSPCVSVAILGDCVNGQTEIDIGFEAPGAFKSSTSRCGLLPYVIRALYDIGKVQLLVTEALMLTPSAIHEIEKKTTPSTRTLIELTTDAKLARKRFIARKDSSACPSRLYSVEAQTKLQKKAHTQIHHTPVLAMSSSLAKKYLVQSAKSLRSEESCGE